MILFLMMCAWQKMSMQCCEMALDKCRARTQIAYSMELVT